MKLRFYYIWLFIIFMYVPATQAGEMWCDMRGTLRCSCPAFLSVDCGDGFWGQIANEEKPSSIVVSVYNEESGRLRDYELKNPQDGIESLHNIERNTWAIKQLGDQGVALTSKITLKVKTAKFPESLTLYRDGDKKEPLTRAQGSANSKYAYQCFYTESPQVVTTQGCSTKICAGVAQCWKNGKLIGDRRIACVSANGSCPSASACLADPAVQFEDAKGFEIEPFEDSLPKTAVK